jgi:hypothetical protein
MCGVMDKRSKRLLVDSSRTLGGARVFCADAFMAPSAPPELQGIVLLAPGLRPGFLPPSGEAVVESVSQLHGIPRSHLEPWRGHGLPWPARALGRAAAALRQCSLLVVCLPPMRSKMQVSRKEESKCPLLCGGFPQSMG